MAARSGILHIGLPKTATTSCQAALHAHRDMLLERHGTLYPGFAPNHTDALCAMFLDDPRQHITVRMKGVTTPDGAEELRRAYFAQVEGEVERTEWSTLALSAEGLSNLSAAELGRLMAWLLRYAEDWTVFLWARHPVGYTTSVIQQIVKGGETIAALTAQLPLPNVRAKASNAFRAFGRERVRIGVFEEARAQPGGVVAAFCREMKLPEDTAMEIAGAAPVLNESMSMLATLVLDSLNRQRPLFVNGSLNAKRRRGEVGMLQRIGGERFRLPADTEAEVRRQARDDVAWLSEVTGRPQYQDVFEDPRPARTEDTPSWSPAAIDSLALLLSDLINGRPQPPRPSG